ncbi:hypothetical protein Acr_12g0004650 [Actinidia rufa]|uniref:Retrovirus-related Pol polyprotein from transposon TNT 1-94-like beta-barrel domain-containing protein n=1 Tax=Actinidia rufa TaxID=165716 RepID=A0A7J0FGU5_9ERIC|nr:hypothetical protein Acr_12g0004650 [Actinidia rufa]
MEKDDGGPRQEVAFLGIFIANRRDISRGIAQSIKHKIGLLDIAATVMTNEDKSDILLAALADRKSDWVLDSGSAYYLCRDKEVFSTYAACEGCIWVANNIASRVVDKGSVQFCITEGSGGTLRVSKEIRRCCGEERPEGYTNWREVSRQGELLSDMGPVVLARRNGQGKQPLHKEVCLDMSGTTSVGCPEGSSKEGDQVTFEELYSKGRGEAETSLFRS